MGLFGELIQSFLRFLLYSLISLALALSTLNQQEDSYHEENRNL
ncbi:hypothetical protein FTV88_1767 [Heliorestis convoluta]|uniref:Uncharacterized protein n=1 Tax=Heliorestis convoluta TaxID=356322 RepID=A0A5Q2N5L2_9FIRM|nr:hypothetical protein FTV88_1767 [Heliorestis convoluta]